MLGSTTRGSLMGLSLTACPPALDFPGAAYLASPPPPWLPGDCTRAPSCSLWRQCTPSLTLFSLCCELEPSSFALRFSMHKYGAAPRCSPPHTPGTWPSSLVALLILPLFGLGDPPSRLSSKKVIELPLRQNPHSVSVWLDFLSWGFLAATALHCHPATLTNRVRKVTPASKY